MKPTSRSGTARRSTSVRFGLMTKQQLLGLLTLLSPDARTLRFFSAGVDLAALARHDSQVDYVQGFGLVATTGPDQRIVGHALVRATSILSGPRLPSPSPTSTRAADSARSCSDNWPSTAAANGISQFRAVVLPTNYRMLERLPRLGLPDRSRTPDPNEIHLELPTSLTPAAIALFERREQIGAVNALTHVLRPTSIAVIGASRRPGTVGAAVFHNLLTGGFAGPVYPVNPKAEVVHSVLAYPTVEDVPGPVDLAVIAVPAAHVLDVAEQCGRKGVRALVVLTAGFGETDAAGSRARAGPAPTMPNRPACA